MVTPNQLSSVCSRSGCTRFDLQAVLGMPTNLIILNLMTNYRPLITSAATVQRKGVFVVGVVWVWCDTMRFDERGVGGFADRQHTGLWYPIGTFVVTRAYTHTPTPRLIVPSSLPRVGSHAFCETETLTELMLPPKISSCLVVVNWSERQRDWVCVCVVCAWIVLNVCLGLTYLSPPHWPFLTPSLAGFVILQKEEFP